MSVVSPQGLVEVLPHSTSILKPKGLAVSSINMPTVLSPLERALERVKKNILAAVLKVVERLRRTIEDLEPRTALPPLPSPARDSDFKRDPNVANCLRKAIEEANTYVPDGNQKYIQFPLHVSSKKLNSDAKDALDILMREKIGENYGDYVWGAACRDPVLSSKCEAVVRKAARMDEFMVFRQTANLWGIRNLAEQRMKSKKASRRANDGGGGRPEGRTNTPCTSADVSGPANSEQDPDIIEPNIPSTGTENTATQNLGRSELIQDRDILQAGVGAGLKRRRIEVEKRVQRRDGNATASVVTAPRTLGRSRGRVRGRGRGHGRRKARSNNVA